MIHIIKMGLGAAGIKCNGSLTFYRWVYGSPEGMVFVTTIGQFRRMLDEEGECFFMDYDHLLVEGLTPHPIELETLGFKLDYHNMSWKVECFPDIVNLPHDLYAKESGEIDREKMEERLRLLNERVKSIIDLITEVAVAKSVT